MQYIGLGVYLEDDLYGAAVKKVIRLANLSHESKKWRERRAYLKAIFSTLTTCKNPKWYHFRYINKAIQLAGMLKKKVEQSDRDPQEALAEIVEYMAPRVNMTPKDILEKIPIDKMQDYYYSIVERDLDASMSRMLEQHSPESRADYITKMYADIRDLKFNQMRIEDKQKFQEKKISQMQSALTMGAFATGTVHV